jgi:hypothetical protein
VLRRPRPPPTCTPAGRGRPESRTPGRGLGAASRRRRIRRARGRHEAKAPRPARPAAAGEESGHVGLPAGHPWTNGPRGGSPTRCAGRLLAVLPAAPRSRPRALPRADEDEAVASLPWSGSDTFFLRRIVEARPAGPSRGRVDLHVKSPPRPAPSASPRAASRRRRVGAGSSARRSTRGIVKAYGDGVGLCQPGLGPDELPLDVLDRPDWESPRGPASLALKDRSTPGRRRRCRGSRLRAHPEVRRRRRTRVVVFDDVARSPAGGWVVGSRVATLDPPGWTPWRAREWRQWSGAGWRVESPRGRDARGRGDRRATGAHRGP